MIFDAGNAIGSGAEVSADVCVVGSGAAALCFAHRLVSSGKKIVILESSRFNAPTRGFRIPPDIMPTITMEDTQELYRGSVGKFVAARDPDYLIKSRLRAYGGSTNWWGGYTRPLDAVDFDRTDLHPIARWPLSLEDLRPFYNLAIQYCSLGTWDISAYDDVGYWSQRTRQPLTTCAFKEGASAREGVVTVIPQRGVGGGRLAFQQAWGAVLEATSNVHIYRNAHVRFLEKVGRSVKRLMASCMVEGRAAHDFWIKASHFVVAAGGIESIRLLLTSDGLGNLHGNLGRYFMLHPVNEVAANYKAGPVLRQAKDGGCFGGFVKGTGWPLGVMTIVVPSDDAVRARRIGNCRVRCQRDNTVSFSWEQLPDRDSRITLDASRDAIFGDPRVRLDWTPAGADIRTMRIGLRCLLDELCASGVCESYTVFDNYVGDLGDHHMGAARMSTAPCDGVVDSNCRIHDVDNVYVAGGAVFPTGGFVHPTLTIIALAIRLAAHIHEQ